MTARASGSRRRRRRDPMPAYLAATLPPRGAARPRGEARRPTPEPPRPVEPPVEWTRLTDDEFEVYCYLNEKLSGEVQSDEWQVTIGPAEWIPLRPDSDQFHYSRQIRMTRVPRPMTGGDPATPAGAARSPDPAGSSRPRE